MKFLFIFFLTCFVLFQGFSQKMQTSESFKYLKKDLYKLLLLKNKNTISIGYTLSKGINIEVYDSSRIKIATGKLDLQLIKDKLIAYSIKSVFESNDGVVIFFQKNEKKTVSLFRILIDGNTGKLKSEDKIIDKEIKDKRYLWGSYELHTLTYIDVIKDPDSDCYAIVTTNDFGSDNMEVWHYNGNNKEINHAIYPCSDSKYSYSRYLCAYIHSNKEVVIAAQAEIKLDTNDSLKTCILLYHLSKDKSLFLTSELYKFKYRGDLNCSFFYNKINDILHLATMNPIKGYNPPNKFDNLFHNINPSTLQLMKSFKVNFKEVSELYKEKMKKKQDFQGPIVGVYINKEGNLIALSQNAEYSNQNGGSMHSPNSTGGMGFSGGANSKLGDVAVIKISTDGIMLGLNIIPISIKVIGHDGYLGYIHNKLRNGFIPAIYPSFIRLGATNYQFCSLTFIPNKTESYLFFNGDLANIDTNNGEKIKDYQYVNNCTALKYSFSDNLVKKERLFDISSGLGDNQYCNFGSSDYNSTNGTYVTYVVHSKSKLAALVWLKLP